MSLPFLLYKLSPKKKETFFLDQRQSRAKIQTMARKHTHSDKVQNMAVLVNNIPFAIFPWEINRAQHFCALSCLRCNGHSTLLNSYLHRVGRAETPSCSNCGSESQDLSYLVLDCPVLDHLRRAIFGHTLSLLDFWSRPWGVARLLGLRGVDPRPHP